jgi:tetratricopeptide (TPR) repeat protein
MKFIKAWPEHAATADEKTNLLRQKEINAFKSAVEVFTRAVEKQTDDKTIQDFVGDSLARLGQSFYRQARDFSVAASSEQDAAKARVLCQKAREVFKMGAEVFAQMADRVPKHKLAWRTRVLAGQCYMRAELFREAIRMFMSVIESADADDKTKPEGMYWCAECHMKLGEQDSDTEKKKEHERLAHSILVRLREQYPDTTWANYAGRAWFNPLGLGDFWTPEEKERVIQGEK